MQKGHKTIRIVAAVCSFALMGAYVFMRGTHRDLFTGQVMAQTTAPATQRTILPSSKSMTHVKPDQSQVTYPDGHVELTPDRSIITGSKILVRTIKPEDVQRPPATQPEWGTGVLKLNNDRAMMGSSKSGVIIQQQQQPVMTAPPLTLQSQSTPPATQPVSADRVLMPEP